LRRCKEANMLASHLLLSCFLTVNEYSDFTVAFCVFIAHAPKTQT
jgi:hypothetical protein